MLVMEVYGEAAEPRRSGPGPLPAADFDPDGKPAPAGNPERELGESRWAPSSTPTPSRSTNSPPNQPVTTAITTPVSPATMAPVGSTSGLSRRSTQLKM